MENLNDRIRSLRNKYNLTQIELAGKLSITPKVVEEWEAGVVMPDFPSIVEMSSIFGVTIDYLVTGKIEDKISLDDMDAQKREWYLIKHDDVENFKKYGYVDPDILVREKNSSRITNEEKKLVQLIYENNSKKIFLLLVQASFKKYYSKNRSYYEKRTSGFKAKQINGDLDNYIRMCCCVGYLNGLIFIDLKYFMIGTNTSAELKKFHIRDYDSVCDQDYATCTLSMDTLQYAMNIKTSSKEIIDYLSDVEAYSERNNRVYFMADEVASCLYNNGDYEKLNEMINILDANNKTAANIYSESLKDSWYNRKRFIKNAIYYINDGHGESLYLKAYVYPLSMTLACALKKKDLKWIRKINDYNCRMKELIPELEVNVLSSHDINVVEVESNPSSTSEQIWDAKYVFYGVLDLKAFLHNEITYDSTSLESLTQEKAIINNEMIKYVLNRPIHEYELILISLQSNDLKTLFRIAVDSGNKILDNALVTGDTKEIMSVAKSFLPFKGINDELNVKDNLSIDFFDSYKKTILNTLMDEIDASIEKITLDRKYAAEFERIKREIPADYLNNELKKENYDNVILKLCVKLEAILKYGYRYQGDLFDMLERYINEHLVVHELHNCCDDEDNNYYFYRDEDMRLSEENKETERMITILQKLRMKRNSLVHCEASEVNLSPDEIAKCIAFVETM